MQVQANGITLEVERFGATSDEAVVLIMGLGAQLTRWPRPLCDKLVAKGLQVVRFDNRDVGLSTKFDQAGFANFGAILKALAAGAPPPIAYSLDDMARDVVGLLDALEIDRAHVVGASMGGMIAQLVAADHPTRVRSLTSIMSTTANRGLPGPTPEALGVLLGRPPEPKVDLEGYLAFSVNANRVIGSPGFPMTESMVREAVTADLARNFSPGGYSRQYGAVIASPDRRSKLATITCPTVVMHGAADPLIPVEAGRDTAANVPNAELRIIEGMGHNLPPQTFDFFAEAIWRAVERSRS
jgi:pimeloyl-ACP methyl ester carboxylesterase